jgi:hypothetical protein
MSEQTYAVPCMNRRDEPPVWLHGEVKSPPLSKQARLIVILEVFSKKTARTPAEIIEKCRQRLRSYDDA